MAEREAVELICEHALKLSKSERIQRTKELVAESEEGKTFIQQFFPGLYQEAFPQSLSTYRAGGRSELSLIERLCAKPK
jgi:hypothetical protein